MNILIKPIITEKATNDSELNNRYTFQVNVKSNKVEIKKAVDEGKTVFADTKAYQVIKNKENTNINKLNMTELLILAFFLKKSSKSMLLV